MSDVVFEFNRDLNVSMRDQVVPGHNRWHPEIPPAATLRTGMSVNLFGAVDPDYL